MRRFVAGLAVAAALNAEPLYACAACYGQSDSPLAKGMNWGIFCLLGVITCVLSGVVMFFAQAARRSTSLKRPAPNPPAETEQ